MTTPVWLTKASGNQEFYTNEGCYITELLNSDASPRVSVAIARVKPGNTTQLHALDKVYETYVLRSGSGIMEVDGQQHPVETGDQIAIAANIPQRITNTGETDLEFYCICVPRFTPVCYLEL